MLEEEKGTWTICRLSLVMVRPQGPERFPWANFSSHFLQYFYFQRTIQRRIFVLFSPIADGTWCPPALCVTFLQGHPSAFIIHHSLFICMSPECQYGCCSPPWWRCPWRWSSPSYSPRPTAATPPPTRLAWSGILEENSLSSGLNHLTHISLCKYDEEIHSLACLLMTWEMRKEIKSTEKNS